VLKKGKEYPLLREEREKVHKFIEKKIKKEYIRLLKSFQVESVFFVGKKNGKKCMVQDYKYLNEYMIKNNYFLPLISNIIENISTKKVFTKLDL